MADLKPCPFCGGSPVVRVPGETDGFALHIRCRCGIELYGAKAHFPTAESATDAWNTRAAERAGGGACTIQLNEDTIDILGRPNFTCFAIAQTLRLRGDDIPNRSENEQAATIAFLLGHYFASGSSWRESATEELSRITSQRVADLRADGEAG